MRGRVTKWMGTRGYGFLRADNGPPVDIFVHASVIVSDEPYKTLVVGEPVDFEMKRTERGLVAEFVIRLNETETP